MLNNSTGIWMNNEGITLNLHNSLIASDRNGADCWGRLTQNNGNLIEDGRCAPMLSGDPMLEEVAEDATTVAPSDGSPAIDAADPRFCPATDQIGNARPQGRGCDIGAIEMPASASDALPASAESTSWFDCQVTTTNGLNFRDGPSLDNARIGLVRQGATLEAIGRTAGWFHVVYQGAEGWISADYVEAEGNCG